MKRTALLALSPLLLAGCGGGGGGSSEVNLRVGSYAGTFAATPRSSFSAPDTLASPQSGAATATISRDGSFEIHAGAPLLLYGRAGRDGKDGVARCAVVADVLDGSGTYTIDYPATVAFVPRGTAYGVAATVSVDTSTLTESKTTPVDLAITVAHDAGTATSG